MPSLNEKIQDAYLVREVTVRRVSAGVANRLDAKVLELGHELAALARRIDPISPRTELEKMRRRKALDRQGTVLIGRRMEEMRTMLKTDLKAIGVYEASFARQLLEDALNGIL